METIQFDKVRIIAECETCETAPGGYSLTGASIQLSLPDTPRYYYHHGWQSWSLAAWTEPRALPTPKPTILNPMQIDPVYARHPSPHGNWLGAVKFADGKVLLLGALGLDSHVQLRDGTLQGWYESGSGAWFAAYGDETMIFSDYAQLIKETLGSGRITTPHRIWCSWYSLYTAIDENILAKTFEGLGDLPFDVLQVDDGWQVKIGDWEANEKFPSGMNALAQRIKATGRKAGLWLAPLIAVESSSLFKNHPGWFIRQPNGNFVSAGFNWGERVYALDTTHPAALEWLAALMKQVRTWGFDYLKLDFLYAGALPGKRHEEMPREAACRKGLAVMREAMGEDAFFLTCGAPILPSIGLCDAIRIGPDVAASWEDERDAVLLGNPTTPGTKNAIRTCFHRLWLQPLVQIDPDVVYFRSKECQLSEEQKSLLQDLALVCNFKATSDLPQWMNDAEHARLRDYLNSNPEITRTGETTYRIGNRDVDFAPAMPIPPSPGGLRWLESALVGWLGNQGWVLTLLNRLGKQSLKKLVNSL